MSGVRLTKLQAAVLEGIGYASSQGGYYYSPRAATTTACKALAAMGLAECKAKTHSPWQYEITPAGRAWLAANKQGGEREQAE